MIFIELSSRTKKAPNQQNQGAKDPSNRKKAGSSQAKGFSLQSPATTSQDTETKEGRKIKLQDVGPKWKRRERRERRDPEAEAKNLNQPKNDGESGKR